MSTMMRAAAETASLPNCFSFSLRDSGLQTTTTSYIRAPTCWPCHRAGRPWDLRPTALSFKARAPKKGSCSCSCKQIELSLQCVLSLLALKSSLASGRGASTRATGLSGMAGRAIERFSRTFCGDSSLVSGLSGIDASARERFEEFVLATDRSVGHQKLLES